MSPDFDAFITSYYERFARALLDFDKGPLRDVLAVFDKVIADGGIVWVAGNGGSAPSPTTRSAAAPTALMWRGTRRSVRSRSPRTCRC